MRTPSLTIAPELIPAPPYPQSVYNRGMNPPLVNFVILDHEQAESFKQIRLLALKTAPQAFGASYAHESAQPLAFFAERLANSIVVAARMENEIIGIAGFKQMDGLRERHKGFIWGVFTRPEHRRKGISGRLLATLLAQADNQVEQTLLTVTAGNLQALSLYQRLGFRTYGTEPRSLKDEAGYHDEILMVRFRSDKTGS